MRAKAVQGFTLVELMVVVGIVAILLVGVSNLFFATLQGGGKAAELAELKDQGDFAITTMERLIRGGVDIGRNNVGANCSSRAAGGHDTDYLQVDYVDNSANPTRVITFSGGKILVDGYDLTTDAVTVTTGGNLFHCVEDNDTFTPDEVKISFSLNSGSISESFQTTVVLRNTNSD